MKDLKVLNKIADLALGVGATRGDKDLALWHKWKAMPTDSNLSDLLKQLDPLIQREVNNWSGTLARPLLEAEGRRLAVQGINNYSDTRGAALATHVTNYLKKLSRLSYSHQSIARLPENKRLKYHTYDVAHNELQEQLGRPPGVNELADHLGWSTSFVTKFQNEAVRKELLESGPVPTGFEQEEHDNTIDLVHHDLTPVQQQIMEHLTGFRDQRILDNEGIMKKLNLTQGQYSYQKRLVTDAFLKAQDLMQAHKK